MPRLLVWLSVALSGACGAAAPAVESASTEPEPAACGSSLAALHTPISPGWTEIPEAPVAAIRVDGAQTVPDRLVREAIELPVDEPIDAATVRSDIRRILELAVFADVRVHADTSPRGLTVIYEVVERPLVREVHVSGLGEGVEEHRLDAVADEVFVPQRLHRLARKLQSDHRREGYADAVARVRGRRVGSRAVDVCFAVDAGRRWLIEDLEFDGNDRLSDDELHALVETFDGRVNDPGGVYREDLLATDLQRITAAYYDRGMVGVRVSEPRTEWKRDGLHVRVPIEEGPVYRLDRVTVTGDLDGPPRAYLQLLALRSGDTFSRERVTEGLERIRERDADRGTVEVRPTTDIDGESHTIDLEIEVTLGDAPPISTDEGVEAAEIDIELSEDELRIDDPPPGELEP